MVKRRAEAEEAPKSAKTAKPTVDAAEGELLVDPEKPWFLVKIKETWEVTGPRPGAAAELADITKRAAEIYAKQVAIYDKRT